MDESTPAAVVGGDGNGGSSGASTNAGEEVYASDPQRGDGGSSGSDGTADGGKRAGDHVALPQQMEHPEGGRLDHVVAAAVHLDISKAAALLQPIVCPSVPNQQKGGSPAAPTGPNVLSSGSSLPAQTRQGGTGMFSSGDSGNGAGGSVLQSHTTDNAQLRPATNTNQLPQSPGNTTVAKMAENQAHGKRPTIREGVPHTREVPLGLQELMDQGNSRSNAQQKRHQGEQSSKQEQQQPEAEATLVGAEEDEEAEAAAAVLGSLRHLSGDGPSGRSAFTSMTVFLPRGHASASSDRAQDKAVGQGQSPASRKSGGGGEPRQLQAGDCSAQGGLLIPPLPHPSSLVPQQLPASPVMLPDSIVRLISALSSAKPSALAAAGAALHPTSMTSSGVTTVGGSGALATTSSGGLLSSGSLGFGFEGSDIDSKASRRQAAVAKYLLKRKNRCFQKKVRYESRKKLADSRPRVRGQFVKHAALANGGDSGAAHGKSNGQAEGGSPGGVDKTTTAEGGASGMEQGSENEEGDNEGMSEDEP